MFKHTIGVAAIALLTLAAEHARADTFGTAVGTYNGVTAYSNGSSSPNYFSNQLNTVNGYVTGYKWQCVEFTTRYYWQVYGLKIGGLGNANNWFANASGKGLKSYDNGGTVAPQAGDVLCSNYGPGHVSIVREVGSTYIVVVQQNWYCDSRDNAMKIPMTVTPATIGPTYCTPARYTVQPVGSYTWRGWLRR